jgi:hypothetical protein
MKNIELMCIWKKKSTVEKEQAIALWKRFNTFSSQEVTHQRASEIAFVAKKNNEIIGVTTVRPLKVKLLNDNYFYEFRIFISPDHRMPGLDVVMTVKTKQFFEENPSASEHPCIGLVVGVTNEKIRQNWNWAVWPDVDMVFVGYAPNGDHIRVSYFKGARI